MCGIIRPPFTLALLTVGVLLGPAGVAFAQDDTTPGDGIREKIRERMRGQQPAQGDAQAAAAELGARQTLNCNGVKISYIVKGKGEPVVLIHGLYSSIVMNWQMPGTIDLLAKDYQVIAMDLPGHGMSDKPEKEEAYGVEMVEDVIRVMDQEKIKKAHIVGYSMGGMIAAKLIAKYPERALSGTLGGMGWLREGGFLQKIWEGMGKREAMGTPPECVKSFGKLALSEAELKAITVPMTVLVGDRDPCKKLYVAPLQEVRNDWPVIEIEDAGHFNCIAKPQFKEGLKKWIEKNAQK